MKRSCKVIEKDVLKWAIQYKGKKFHALLTDPPYHVGGVADEHWAGCKISFEADTWGALTEHLFPGALGLSFASARSWPHIALAIEKAGLILHHSLFGWVFGSGWPKGSRVTRSSDEDSLVQVWDGHRYGLQSLRPALEPILLFQKPFEGDPRDCTMKHGAGAFNVAAGRVGERQPSNFVLGRCEDSHPDSPADRLDKQVNRGSKRDDDQISSFFATFDPVIYCPKPANAERDAGVRASKSRRGKVDQTIGSARKRAWQNPHPAVKPIALCRWLALLLLPPEQYAPRHMFVPFAGSGSECTGSMLAGWDEVLGVELNHEYAAAANDRIGYWRKHRTEARARGLMGKRTTGRGRGFGRHVSRR